MSEKIPFTNLEKVMLGFSSKSINTNDIDKIRLLMRDSKKKDINLSALYRGRRKVYANPMKPLCEGLLAAFEKKEGYGITRAEMLEPTSLAGFCLGAAVSMIYYVPPNSLKNKNSVEKLISDTISNLKEIDNFITYQHYSNYRAIENELSTIQNALIKLQKRLNKSKFDQERIIFFKKTLEELLKKDVKLGKILNAIEKDLLAHGLEIFRTPMQILKTANYKIRK